MINESVSSHSKVIKKSQGNDYVPFKLHWVFGHDTKVSPINISSSTIKGIFFCSGAVAVCYDWVKRTQTMLHGHVHPIVSMTATSDKTFLASADRGPENSLIVWHRRTGKMVFILSNHFPEEGVIFMCFSEDANLLLTITGGIIQELSLWDWKAKKKSPNCTFRFNKENSFQHFATFHHKDSSHFASCSKENVYFFKVHEGKVIFSVLDLSILYDEKACRRAGSFTQTVFSTISSLAYTATTKGMIVIWGNASNSKKKSDQFRGSLMVEPGKRTCLRAMQIFTSRCSLSYLGQLGDYLVVGTELGQVCYFDEAFKLQWSIDITEDAICSVSFNFKPRLTFKQAVFRAIGKDLQKEDGLEKTDFIACTRNGFAGYVKVVSSEVNEVLFGTSSLVKDVAVHPSKPYIYFGDNNGGLQKWNFRFKTLINKSLFQGPCPQIECLSVDSKGTYVACALFSGEVVIFDAVSFAPKPCFTAHDIKNRLVFIKFSPDPQHLIVTDAVSNVFRYQLNLLVPPVYQMMQKGNVPPEEPVWNYNGKAHQHRGRILDCMFNNPSKDESLYFLTLGEDRYVVQYNISNSKNMNITVVKRMALDSIPICMSWYPLYDLSEALSVLCTDGRLHVYNMKDEEMIKIVTVPSFEESFQRVILLENIIIDQDASFQRCIAFHTATTIGLAKFPLDGNPFSVLAMSSHPHGINSFITNNEKTFAFTAGKKDSWIYMYEINFASLLESEKVGGLGIDAFKSLFPTNENSEEMKKKLIYSVYSLELEMKMLQLGTHQYPILKGEIPVNFLEYVMAALGCFLSPDDLQMMLNDVKFENKYLHSGKKLTLNCLDIMKLYVNYRPKDPLTMEKVHQSFKDILLADGDPDEISRERFLSILKSEGHPLPPGELVAIVSCLKDNKFKTSSKEDNTEAFSDKMGEIPSPVVTDPAKMDDPLINNLIPEVVTEDIFFQDILCIEQAKEDLSGYVLEEDDYELRDEPFTVDDFVFAIEESNLANKHQNM